MGAFDESETELILGLKNLPEVNVIQHARWTEYQVGDWSFEASETTEALLVEDIRANVALWKFLRGQAG